MKLLRQVLVVPVLGALVLTGCSGGAGSKETNKTQLAAADINAADPANVVAGGELRLAVDKFGSLNPMSASSNAELAELQQAFLPTFFRYDEAGVATPNPDFLESATETATNPTQVTLKLNPSATWADGKQITAADVIATWNACNGRSAGFRCAADLQFNQIAAVTQGASTTEVQLRFTKAYPQWRGVFDRVSVLRAESVKDAETFNNGWAQVHREWSSGPFAMASGSLSAKAVVATPYDKWWGSTKPSLARLSIREVARDNQVKAFADSQIDAVDTGGTQAAFDSVRTVPGTSIRRAGSPESRQLVFNTASANAVNEVPVRQAIAVALDRSGVGTAAMPGIGFTAAPLDNRIFLPAQHGYADNAAELKLTRDLGKAEKLLNSAGWRERDGVRSRDGRPLELRLAQVQGVETSENEARAISEQLAGVGIRTTVVTITPADLANKSALSRGDFDMIVLDIDGGRHPLATLADRFGSGAEENWARFENLEIDGLIQKIDAEPDPAAQITLANQLDQKLWEQMPTVPLYQLPQSIAVNVQVTGFGAPGLSSIAWEKIGHTKP